MKKLITILSLMTVSSTVFAHNVPRCADQIIEAAQVNLDLKAKGYHIGAITFGNINTESLQLVDENKKTKDITAKMNGMIHVGNYEVQVTVDNYCTLTAVKITDLGER